MRIAYLIFTKVFICMLTIGRQPGKWLQHLDEGQIILLA